MDEGGHAGRTSGQWADKRIGANWCADRPTGGPTGQRDDGRADWRTVAGGGRRIPEG